VSDAAIVAPAPESPTAGRPSRSIRYAAPPRIGAPRGLVSSACGALSPTPPLPAAFDMRLRRVAGLRPGPHPGGSAPAPPPGAASTLRSPARNGTRRRQPGAQARQGVGPEPRQDAERNPEARAWGATPAGSPERSPGKVPGAAPAGARSAAPARCGTETRSTGPGPVPADTRDWGGAPAGCGAEPHTGGPGVSPGFGKGLGGGQARRRRPASPGRPGAWATPGGVGG